VVVPKETGLTIRTVTAKFKVQNIANTDINDAKETLIPPFELALIEYLNCYDRGFVGDGASVCFVQKPEGRLFRNAGLHIKALIPIRIQSLLHYTGGVGLFRVDGNDSEGVREPEDITLG